MGMAMGEVMGMVVLGKKKTPMEASLFTSI